MTSNSSQASLQGRQPNQMPYQQNDAPSESACGMGNPGQAPYQQSSGSYGASASPAPAGSRQVYAQGANMQGGWSAGPMPNGAGNTAASAASSNGSAANPNGKGKSGTNKLGGKKGKKHSDNGKGGSNGKSKGKHPVSFYVAIAIAAVAIVAVGVFAWMTFADQPQHTNRGGIIGQVDGKSKEEIQAELDRIIEEGMFNISIASYVEFDDGTSEGELKVENVPNNPYLMQVKITRNDTGEVIYTSDVLEPNYHIQSDKLDKDVEAGTYECTATFYALDKETEEEVGSAAAVMTISVLN